MAHIRRNLGEDRGKTLPSGFPKGSTKGLGYKLILENRLWKAHKIITFSADPWRSACSCFGFSWLHWLQAVGQSLGPWKPWLQAGEVGCIPTHPARVFHRRLAPTLFKVWRPGQSSLTTPAGCSMGTVYTSPAKSALFRVAIFSDSSGYIQTIRSPPDMGEDLLVLGFLRKVTVPAYVGSSSVMTDRAPALIFSWPFLPCNLVITFFYSLGANIQLLVAGSRFSQYRHCLKARMTFTLRETGHSKHEVSASINRVEAPSVPSTIAFRKAETPGKLDCRRFSRYTYLFSMVMAMPTLAEDPSLPWRCLRKKAWIHSPPESSHERLWSRILNLSSRLEYNMQPPEPGKIPCLIPWYEKPWQTHQPDIDNRYPVEWTWWLQWLLHYGRQGLNLTAIANLLFNTGITTQRLQEPLITFWNPRRTKS